MKIIVILLISINIIAQPFSGLSNYKNTSLDVTIDPASVAMGESFIANYLNSSSFIENPANLSQKNNTTFFYNTRSLNWITETESFKFTSVGGTLKIGLGNLGIAYNEFRSGKSIFNSQSNDSNSSLMFSLSKNVIRNLNIGISLKFFNHKRISDFGIGSNLESNTAILLDFGAIYKLFSISNIKSNHELIIGTSFQNFGTDYKEKDYLFNSEYIFIRLPKYWKIGFAYNLNFENQNAEKDIDFLITGSYKNFLNPLKNEKGDVDYWGFGTQIKIKEFFITRIGLYQTPEHNILYDRAKPLLRYGFGINLPLKKIGLDIPITISTDYSFIPINQIQIYNLEGNLIKSKKSLYSAGISIKIKDLFIEE